MSHLAPFFHAVPDIAAMLTVEDIFHHQTEYDLDDEEADFDDEEAERLEDILAEHDYSYVGINSIVYLYKGDDLIADLDTDDYSWHKIHDETIDPFTQIHAFIDAIAEGLPH